MIFLDDNPFERDIVKQNIPDITVPNLPEDPTLYLNYLRELNLFETTSVSVADKQRTEQYQAEAKRVVLKKTFASEAEYLLSLEMQCEINSFNNFNLPRIAQLIQRSNQFNLRTQRFSEQELAYISNHKKFLTYAFNLCDKFGDHGLICTVILEKKQYETLFINTWLMSCRVLKRGVENFVLNEIVAVAKENNCQKIIGEYLSTPKNEIVKDHYKNLGFSELSNTQWILDVSTYNQQISYINKK
jgi:FkbH-like protein